MNKKVLTIFVLLFLATGLTTLGAAQAQGGKEGKGVAVITQSFASQAIRPGETWKVYLKASAPDGEMKNIFALVEQPGVGPYPLGIIGIKKENKKELSGYIYLNTSTPRASLEFVTLNLTVQIQDASGNYSQPAIFPLSFISRSAQEMPPPGVFPEQDLGPIMVTLRIVDDGDHERRGRHK
jgi:hypothetical protein